MVCPSDKRFLLLFTFLKKNRNKKIMVRNTPIMFTRHRLFLNCSEWLSIGKMLMRRQVRRGSCFVCCCIAGSMDYLLFTNSYSVVFHQVFFSSCNSVKFHSELLNYIDMPVMDIHGRQKQQKRTTSFFQFCRQVTIDRGAKKKKSPSLPGNKQTHVATDQVMA